MSLDDKINAAKTAQEANPPHADVEIVLDPALSAERAKLTVEVERLEEQKAQTLLIAGQSLALKPETTSLDKQIASLDRKLKKLTERERDYLVTVRLMRHPGDEWFDLKSTCPARVNSVIDRAVGYNVNTLTKASVEMNARIVESDEVSHPTGGQWSKMWPLIAGSGFESLADAVYNLNAGDPQAQVERLKKS